MKGILLIAEDLEIIQSLTEKLSPVYTIYFLSGFVEPDQHHY